jgi:hypothetical protein
MRASQSKIADRHGPLNVPAAKSTIHFEDSSTAIAMRLRFTIRDLLWLTLVVAMAMVVGGSWRSIQTPPAQP